MQSGIILAGDSGAYDIVDMLGGGTPMGAGHIEQYAPRSGLIVDKTGAVRDVVDLLGGGTPLAEYGQTDMTKYTPKSGIILGADGYAYDLADLLEAFAGGAGTHPIVKQTADFLSDQSPWDNYPGFAYQFTRAYIGDATRASMYICVSEPTLVALQVMTTEYFILEKRTSMADGNGWHSIDIPASAGDSFFLSFCAVQGDAILGLTANRDADWVGAVRATSSNTPGEYSWWEVGDNSGVFPLVRFER